MTSDRRSPGVAVYGSTDKKRTEVARFSRMRGSRSLRATRERGAAMNSLYSAYTIDRDDVSGEAGSSRSSFSHRSRPCVVTLE